MLTNLQQLPIWLWVLAILLIVVASAALIYLRRNKFRLSKLEVTGGPVKAVLEPDKTGEPTAPTLPVQPPSISIRGNKIFGRNILRIRRQGTNVEDNLIAGENEIEVGDKPGPKPKQRRG